MSDKITDSFLVGHKVCKGKWWAIVLFGYLGMVCPIGPEVVDRALTIVSSLEPCPSWLNNAASYVTYGWVLIVMN